jgi:hypothetical protein
MDINTIVKIIMEKIGQNSDFKTDFLSNPTETIKSVAGVDLPEGQINTIVETVMEKIGGDKITDALGTFKKLF